MVSENNADIDLNFAELFYTELSDKTSFIAMQDMSVLGYQEAINKRKGLNPDHIKLVLKELANFHACSYVFINSFPGGIDGAKEKYPVSDKISFTGQFYTFIFYRI